ncbi:MAG: lytic transglycosylase domain-containing protein [Rhodospirillaceae bacterium]
MTRWVRQFSVHLRRLCLLIPILSLPWLLGACASGPAPEVMMAPPPPATIEAGIQKASMRFNMPEKWIRAVMAQESGGRTHINGQPIVSKKGAMGLMQIMPATWAYLRDAYKLGNDPFDPHDNIMAGTAYLREMYDQYGTPGFLAAYNAGPGRYQAHLRTQQPLPGETQRYVAMIAPRLEGAQPDGPSPTRPVPVSRVPIVVAALAEPDAPPPPPPAVLVPVAVRAQTVRAEIEQVRAEKPLPPVRLAITELPAPRGNRDVNGHQPDAKPGRITPGRIPNVQAYAGRPGALPPGWYVPVAYTR